MSKKRTVTYKDAGVDLDVADAAKKRIARLVRSTESSKTLGTFGLFGGAIDVGTFGAKGMTLVASIDGVGTKTKIAELANQFDTIGVDIVSHCVNDILCQGATPLFFMDYIASSRLDPEQVVEIVRGIASACKKNKIVLLGGETAEMPGVYAHDAFDLVGAIVGIMKKRDFISGDSIKEGDVLISLPSSGLHTNGYSLVRKVFFEIVKADINATYEGLSGSLGEELLKPHMSYQIPIQRLRTKVSVKGLAHITGGGVQGNLSRIVPKGLSAHVELSGIKRGPIFHLIQSLGNVPVEDMYRTFNMGVGMIVCVSAAEADKALTQLRKDLPDSQIIGGFRKGRKKVEMK